jgi:hypothetical protein
MPLRKPLLWLLVLLAGTASSVAGPVDAHQSPEDVYLAFVHENVVKLADAQGNPTVSTGPEFQPGQAATLFWSLDGERLYVARRDGFFQTGAAGGAAVRLSGNYGITVTLDRTGDVIYYLESTNPQPTDNQGVVTFPLREFNTLVASGGTGRLVGYVGDFAVGSAQIALSGAAYQYARDGGLLGSARPRLFATYGTTMFYSCCFPEPGLSAIDLPSGEKRPYDAAFVPGMAAVNDTLSRLAGPTTGGSIRIFDLITAGTRDYVADVGEIERIAWASDDSALYLAVRSAPREPLELTPLVTALIDTRSADIFIWRLDLVTGRLSRLAELGDYYGVSSIAATDEYIFVVAVERNQRLVDDLNAGRLPGDISPNDPRLNADYLPGSVLFRVRTDGSEALSILADVWGVVARPRR